MKAIILAAGYATRMYPLTLDKPKALLDIKGKPLVEYIIEKIEEISDIDKIIIITNNKFYKLFINWQLDKQKKFSKKIHIINDFTNTNEERLGGIGDLWFCIDKLNISDDLLVLNSDNLFDFSLDDAVVLFNEKKKIINGIYFVSDRDAAKKHGVVRIINNKVIEYVEKPENPKSNLVSIGIYIFPKKYIKKIKEYLDSGQNKEGPGYLIKYFYEKGDEVFGYLFKGKLYDMGSIDTYKKINEI